MSCARSHIPPDGSEETSCSSNCTDVSWGWCKYSALYLVFCSRSEGFLTPGTSLSDMISIVDDAAEECYFAANGTRRDSDDRNDDDDDEEGLHNSINSTSDTSVGAALSAVLGKI